ncbi:MAG: Xaa-Pro peptidase family protein [Pseudomonadota bacterium]
MLELTKQRTAELQDRLAEEAIDLAVITDPDSIAFLAGFWGYLGIEFGRPTLLLVPRDGDPIVITPLMEREMVAAMTWVQDVRPWQDDGPESWQAVLEGALAEHKAAVLGTEGEKTAGPISAHMAAHHGGRTQRLVTGLISAMRVIKTPLELDIMRQAGQVAIAMVEAGKGALAEGVPEYEAALAVIAGGSRKAAEFLTDRGWEAFVSPVIHNLQILQSGHDTAMVHRRASVRRLGLGDPVYFCFCNMANFKQYKLGFDRQFFIGEVSDDKARDYERTIAAQGAALGAIHAGAIAEEVHFAAAEVYQAAGYGPGYRTGRSIGISYLEAPELKAGDKTVLREGMTFAVDGGITVDGQYGCRVGDSIVVTKEGFEYLTPFPKELTVV